MKEIEELIKWGEMMVPVLENSKVKDINSTQNKVYI